MNQNLVELEVKLERITKEAKIIMWLSFIGIINPPLFLIVLIYFLFHNNKFSKLKHAQYFSGIFNNLNDKSSKELKYIRQQNGEPLEQGVANLLHSRKSMVAALIVVGVIVVIIIAIIGIYSL